jgi:hypothetical protein
MLLIINLPATLRQAPAADDSGNDTPTLTDECIEHFVAEAGVDRIWRAIDRLTAADELPLAATE